MKLVDTTPRATAILTTIRGSVIIEALPVAGKYNDLITPSQGIKIPIKNSYANNARSVAVNDRVFPSSHTDGTNKSRAEKR